MLGRFSEEALLAFAASHSLDTGTQDFSEGVFDFKRCEAPDGTTYGIPNKSKCKAPSKEVYIHKPGDAGFLNLNTNYWPEAEARKLAANAKTIEERAKNEPKIARAYDAVMQALKNGEFKNAEDAEVWRQAAESLNSNDPRLSAYDEHVKNLISRGLVKASDLKGPKKPASSEAPKKKPEPKPAPKPKAPVKPKHSRGEIINQADYAYFMAIQAGANSPMQARMMARKYLSEKGYDTSQISDSDWRAIREQNMR